MTNTIEPQSQEFTLQFVGREEEIKFLLDEYDQMLHAQYRSVWIEAPAGMGKTTLVEEFLRRINSESLKPWIVHTHLRERSSNSLASLVEALGVTLQTLIEEQRENLFRGLTSFYQERAKKIVGGENVQAMNMEEAITTAGYVFKRLSLYFPLVIIIEDLHVLKGKMSFSALRHLQAVVEHVPIMVIYVSRPSEEKYLRQIREQTIQEGCTKYEVGGLNFEDVGKIVGTQQVTLSVKKLMHLSGGNPLLLRQILRSDPTAENINVKGSTSERIIHYLTKELRESSKGDRQVIAIAGMLGEEFSEQLLYDITIREHLACWRDDVLERFERKGIIRRRKKILQRKEDDKGIVSRVSIFSHALWWEAARKLYDKEKTWTNKKFARTLLPLLSSESYPLLTDAELLKNLFTWLPARKAVTLLRYVDSLMGVEAPWHFHSHNDQSMVLWEARKCIKSLYHEWKEFDKSTLQVMANIINADSFLGSSKSTLSLSVREENNKFIAELLGKHLVDEPGMRYEIVGHNLVIANHNISQFANEKEAYKIKEKIASFLRRRDKTTASFQAYVQAALYGMEGYKFFFSAPHKAAENFYRLVEKIAWDRSEKVHQASTALAHITVIPASQVLVKRALEQATALLKKTETMDVFPFVRRSVARNVIELHLKAGEVEKGIRLAEHLLEEITHIWQLGDHFSTCLVILSAFAHGCYPEKARSLLDKIFSEQFSLISEIDRFKSSAPSIVLLEESEYFEMLWEKSKNHLTPYKLGRIGPLLEGRILLSLLDGNGKEQETMQLFLEISKRFPAMKHTLEIYSKRVEPFLKLQKGELKKVKKEFDDFLVTDTILSAFDRANYSQLFARIGVRCGHSAKEFSKYVKSSLDGFGKLDLPERVSFIAGKFVEADLFPRLEFEKILRRNLSTKSASVQNEKQSQSLSQVRDEKKIQENGISMQCFGNVRAFTPDGQEIISRWWGKRKSVSSRYKQIVIELICAELQHRSVSKKELLTSLYPEIRRGGISEKKLYQLGRRLSVVLPQLKEAFTPYEIIEKLPDEYQLHPSVKVDIVIAEQNILRAKILARVHLPSAVWLLRHALITANQGKFAAGYHGAGVKFIRQRWSASLKEGKALLPKLEKQMAL